MAETMALRRISMPYILAVASWTQSKAEHKIMNYYSVITAFQSQMAKSLRNTDLYNLTENDFSQLINRGKDYVTPLAFSIQKSFLRSSWHLVRVSSKILF